MAFELTVSMMCADYGHLEQEVRTLWMDVMCRILPCP